MILIPGHKRTPDLKDWEPSFRHAVTELYRAGLGDLAQEAERVGHVRPMPRARRLGELMPAVIARAHAARFRNHQ
ncbi:MAG TPA: hypothetical protein VGF29_05005 [Hyphomicrobiaceae bacterium]|jgi:hypothetical protein